MKLSTENAMILVIDVQEKLVAAQKKAEKISNNTSKLVEAAAMLGLPVIVTEQYPQGLGHTISQAKEKFSDDVKVFEKTSFDCFNEEGFEDLIVSTGRKQILVCGLECHICVYQTVRSLLAKGYEVHLIQDAIGSRSTSDYKRGLARMASEGAIGNSLEMALFDFLGGAKHPNFRAIQGIIK